MKVLNCVSAARDECHNRAGCRDVYLTFDDSTNSFFIPNLLDLLGPYMRAPYGMWTEAVLTTSASAGLAPLHWSVDPRDWSRPGMDAIVSAVLASVGPGAIVLLHGGCPPDELGRCNHAGRREQTLTALSLKIPALHDRGFAIRSLPQPHRTNQIPYEHACRN
ncbi:hypothetical protein F6X37_29530 [Paraburkholderia sp. 31.1]|nr:hypothetical protein [Paraburkholderia sp. 31.1]